MKQHDKHHKIDARPKEGTVIGGLVYGPDPTTRAGSADLGKPLKARRPDLFNGTWRNANQRMRDDEKARGKRQYATARIRPANTAMDIAEIQRLLGLLR